MEWLTEPEVEAEVARVEATAKRQRVARRIAAVLFVVVALLDVVAGPEALAAVSKLCD